VVGSLRQLLFEIARDSRCPATVAVGCDGKLRALPDLSHFEHSPLARKPKVPVPAVLGPEKAFHLDDEATSLTLSQDGLHFPLDSYFEHE
jgi:hypothetical protein